MSFIWVVMWKVTIAEINMLSYHLSGQNPPESPWGQLTQRLLLARVPSYPARSPSIQLWMCLSHGLSMASSLTSNETATISKEWVGWVISSVKLSYFLAFLRKFGTVCWMCKGVFYCPSEGFFDASAGMHANISFIHKWTCGPRRR